MRVRALNALVGSGAGLPTTVGGNSSDKSDSGPVAVMHYVCKTGDFTTPPVFVAITNDRFYEFHWMTMAACPLGIHVGESCTVQHESTGFVTECLCLPGLRQTPEGQRSGRLSPAPLLRRLSQPETRWRREVQFQREKPLHSYQL